MEVYDSAMSKPLYGIHQERTDTLNLNSIANKFAQANERRIAFFGHF